MADRSRGYTRYGSTSRNPFHDSPSPEEYRDDPYSFAGSRASSSGRGGLQRTGYTTFNELVDEITSGIFTINSNVTSLDRCMKQLGTPKDSVHLRDKIHQMEQSTNSVVSEMTRTFRQLSTQCNRADKPQKLQFERLKSEFQDTVSRYSTLQKKVAEKVRTATPVSTHTKSPDLINWGEDNDDEGRLLEEEQRRQLQAQEEILENEVALIEEREQRIHQLECDILDINEIFRDLGTLVHEQGEVIDSIEQNVEKAHDNVEAGRDQLVSAAAYQRKARKKMCCLVSILLIIVAIVVIVIVVEVKKK